MPYSNADDESLPSNVKKMDAQKRRQWIAVFNSSHAAGDDEATSFRKANGVVKDNETVMDSWYTFIAEAAKAMVGHDNMRMPVEVKRAGEGFLTFRDKADDLRFFSWVSNNFKDKQKEIIPEFAHKEFVEWSDKNKTYPELWLWHTPGTKFGQVDWIDVSDGFLVASGTIMKEREAFAETLSTLSVGMSHGMKCIVLKDGTIIAYRSYEISTLPMESAAAVYGSTGFEILSEGVDMAFSEKKKSFLKNFGYSDEQVTAFETKTAEMSANLKAIGYEWKEEDVAGSLPGAVVNISVKEELAPFLNNQIQFVEALSMLSKKVVDLEKSEDEKIATAFTAKFAEAVKSGGFTASESSANLDKTPVAKSKDMTWFGDVMRDIVPIAPGQ